MSGFPSLYCGMSEMCRAVSGSIEVGMEGRKTARAIGHLSASTESIAGLDGISGTCQLRHSVTLLAWQKHWEPFLNLSYSLFKNLGRFHE